MRGIAPNVPQTAGTFVTIDVPAASGGDDSSVIQAALNAASVGDTIRLAKHQNYSALELSIPSGVHVDLNGSTITKRGGDNTTVILRMTGALGATHQALTANAVIGDNTLTVADASGFAAGDYVMIRDNTFAYSSIGRNQEINRVTAASGTTITLANRLIGAYPTAASGEVYKLTPCAGNRLSNGTLVNPAGTSGGVIYGVMCSDVQVRNIKGSGAYELATFGFYESARVRIVDCDAIDGQDQATVGHGYGAFIQASQHCTVKGLYSENVRENLLTGNTRFSGFEFCKDLSSRDSSYNTHGTGSKHCFITHCVSTSGYQNGISVGYTTDLAPDQYIRVTNNVIVNAGNHGINVTAAAGQENVGIVVESNDIYSYGIRLTAMGINVTRTNGIRVRLNRINGVNNNASYGVFCQNATLASVSDNRIENLPNGYGIGWDTVTDMTIERNWITGISSYNLRSTGGASTGVLVRNNRTDDTTNSFAGTETLYGNEFGSVGTASYPSGVDFPATYLPGSGGIAARANSATNRVIYIRNVLGEGLISAIGLHVTNQAGNLNVGIYTNTGSGANAKPGTLKGSSGLTAVPATGYREIALLASTLCQYGEWFGIILDGTTATLNGMAGQTTSNLFKGLGWYEDGLTDLPATANPTAAASLPFCLKGV